MGCNSDSDKVAPGTATVTFVPSVGSANDVSISDGNMNLSHIAIAGDPPPPPMMGVFQVADVDLPGNNVSVQLTAPYAPGKYSGVGFEFHGVMMNGTENGTPFTAHVEPIMPQVALQTTVDQELGNNENVSFTVTIDVAKWFTAGLFDGAVTTMGDGGTEVICDGQNNPSISAMLATNIAASFELQ